MIDPLELAKETQRVVTRNTLRKYYRLARVDRWYGGIISSDCVGCNLRCKFCWSGAPRDFPEKCGRFYSPQEVFHALDERARSSGIAQLRVSGNEPTLARKHLLPLLELIEGTRYAFILETNGILIGHDKSYARDLAKYSRVHVRVSLKGCNEEEFSLLTGAKPEGFKLQLNSLKYLLDANVSCHVAVMLSFSPKESYAHLQKRLKEIDPGLGVEEEYVILYPHVVRRLEAAGIKPLKALTP